MQMAISQFFPRLLSISIIEQESFLFLKDAVVRLGKLRRRIPPQLKPIQVLRNLRQRRAVIRRANEIFPQAIRSVGRSTNLRTDLNSLATETYGRIVCSACAILALKLAKSALV